LGDEAALAAKLAVHDGTALVAWHHEAIPAIARSLGAVDFPRHWPDDRFDVVWTFTRDDTGWRFAQVPQLLLAGDRPDPIG